MMAKRKELVRKVFGALVVALAISSVPALAQNIKVATGLVSAVVRQALAVPCEALLQTKPRSSETGSLGPLRSRLLRAARTTASGPDSTRTSAFLVIRSRPLVD